MRVVELDITDNTIQCPSSLELLATPRRTCRAMNPDTPTCSSNTFTVAVLDILWYVEESEPTM